ncbi:hypothetical protein WN51_04933 [Melipona quadrifasciata]|uniref:Uncharacterized protein n=1 Tax=Melipona quadrifasciata TaxID=166423 RepID=A0A0N0U3G1_9HYME|nr:hypothetical protein WN51_04933 [Melipona quadrifasciata]
MLLPIIIFNTTSHGKRTSREVAATSSSSSDVTTVEVVSSTSVLEEARQTTESESRSNVVEVTSASREVIMDSKGNVIKVIESTPQTVSQATSAYKTTAGKNSQDFIAEEQTQSVKQGKTVRDSPLTAREKVVDVYTDERRGGTSAEQVSRSSAETQSRSETIQKSISSSMVVETSSSSMEDYYDRLSKKTTTSSNGAANEDHAARVQTTSKSYESRQASKETYEETTKDGQTIANISRIHESGEKLDDNGRITATQCRSVDNETTVVPSDVGRVKHTDDARAASDDKVVVIDSSSSTAKSNVKADRIGERCNKPGQSAWDGTFVRESSSAKDKNVDSRRATTGTGLDTAKVDRLVTTKGSTEESVSSVEISESSFIDQRSSSTVIQDSKVIIDEGRSSSTVDTIDLAGGQRQFATSKVHSKDSTGTRYTKPGESTWDGTFVIERMPETRKRNADVTEEIYIDGKPTGKTVEVLSDRRVTRPGDSAWNGRFVYEKPQDGKKPSSGERTVVRTSAKKHDSVDVEDVTEEQNVSSTSESVSSSYIVEYATSTDEKKKKKTTEKVTSVSEIIAEEDSGDGGSPRRSTEEKSEKSVKRDATSRCYKPGQSTWDGSFVYEKPSVPERRGKLSSTDARRSATDSVVIRDVTEDNSINEAEISTASYVVEHSSSQQSFTDVRDSSLSSVHETIVYDVHPVRQDQGPSSSRASTRPATPEKTPKTRDARVDTKPGSSTWDGTFVIERSPETKRPASRESVDRPADKARPEPKESPVPGPRKHVSEDTLDIRDASQRVSAISDTSIVLEQSTVRESHTDSSNLDYSTSSVETVIVRDGVPTTVQKSVTIEERAKSPEKKPPEQKGPEDSKSPDKRLPKVPTRSTKPCISTWDGSFIHEKLEKPTDKKPSTDVASRPSPSPADGRKSPEGKKSTYVTEKSIALSDTSAKSTEFVTCHSTTLERTLVSDSEAFEVSATTVGQVDDEKQSPEKRPKSPEKSSARPTKLGESTWDGSFVHEKPQDRKRPRESPARDEPKDKPSPLSKDDSTKISIVKHDVTDVRDAARKDVIQESSYVIDQSSRFTTVQDVREVAEERVINEFTIDTSKDVKPLKIFYVPLKYIIELQRKTPLPIGTISGLGISSVFSFGAELPKSLHPHQGGTLTVQPLNSHFSVYSNFGAKLCSLEDRHLDSKFANGELWAVEPKRDVTGSTVEFIDKEQVTSMVARDVVDDAKFDGLVTSTPKSPAGQSPRKESPERPGYPRGIPGLREDDRPKPIPAAGKPSRPPQREQRLDCGYTGPSPQSPGKTRDYVSPTEKPSPAAEKPSRTEERPGRPRRRDQSPDSLEEDDVQPGKLPDILSKIPLKEQCICELCTCGVNVLRCLISKHPSEESYEIKLDLAQSKWQERCLRVAFVRQSNLVQSKSKNFQQ